MKVTALITGGSGEIAGFTRPLLLERGWRLRLLDVSPPTAALSEGEEFIAASLLDDDALDAALAGADVMIHLAAHRSERSWSDILTLNIDGTQRVLEAARRAGVRRVLLASSVHAVGFTAYGDLAARDVLVPRPDTYYGVSKAALEALGSVYSDRFGMSIVSARIVNATSAPEGASGRVTWFSPHDAARLFEAVAALQRPGHHIVWGVSAGGATIFPLEPGRAIGYEPEDDATLPGDVESLDLGALVGAEFAASPLGQP